MGKLVNRARMTVSGTPGTGTITLGSAVAGHQSFAGAGVINGDVVSYVLEDGSAWEIGQGTYTSSGTTLARTTILASSNSGSAINATANAIVYIAALASDLTSGVAANNLVRLDGNAKVPAVDASQVTGLTPTQLQSTLNARTASYTLVLADTGKLVTMDVASANTLTVPTNASAAIPIGKSIDVLQLGVGQTQIVAASGVTILCSGTLFLRTQYSVVTLLKIATDTWVLAGDVSP